MKIGVPGAVVEVAREVARIKQLSLETVLNANILNSQ